MALLVIGWTQACILFGFSDPGQPARQVRVAPLMLACPKYFVAFFSVFGLNSIPVAPVGFVPGQIFRSVVKAGSGFMGRAGWVLKAALCFVLVQLSTNTVFSGSKRQYRSVQV